MDQFYSQQWPLLPAKVRSQLMADGFSPAGRRNIFSVSLGKTYRYDADNRLLNVSQDINLDGWLFHVDDIRYDYDNNGNRILKSELTADDGWPLQTRYTYDVENRLTQLDFSTQLSSLGDSKAYFEYDGNGRRVKASEGPHVTNFLYDGTNVILAKDTLSLTEDSYTRGLDEGGGIGGIISRTRYPLQTEYFHYNPQGSVTNLSNKNGTASAAYDYDAYGQTSPACLPAGRPAWQAGTNPYRFSTKEWVGYANLYYFGARYYDPEIGRWLTQDPLGFVNGPNLYLYCGNNPINLVDPLGLFDEYLFTKSVVGLVASSAVAATGIVFAETGFGAVAAVYGAYGVGANAGNIVNSITNNGAGPTGPGQAVGALYGYATNTNSTTFQTIGSVADLAAPLIAGGPNPAQVSEIDALLLSNENTTLQTTQTLTNILNGTQVADAGFTLGESGNTLYTALSPYLNNSAGNSYSNNLGGKEHAY